MTTRPPKTIVKPTALGPVANTDTKLLIYGLFQKGRVLAQDDHPMPPTETVADFYAADYYGAAGIKFRPYIEELVYILTRRQAKRLTRGMAPGSRILDVGCGRGVLAAALADLGFSAHGFEINDNGGAAHGPAGEAIGRAGPHPRRTRTGRL